MGLKQVKYEIDCSKVGLFIVFLMFLEQIPKFSVKPLIDYLPILRKLPTPMIQNYLVPLWTIDYSSYLNYQKINYETISETV